MFLQTFTGEDSSAPCFVGISVKDVSLKAKWNLGGDNFSGGAKLIVFTFMTHSTYVSILAMPIPYICPQPSTCLSSSCLLDGWTLFLFCKFFPFSYIFLPWSTVLRTRGSTSVSCILPPALLFISRSDICHFTSKISTWFTHREL